MTLSSDLELLQQLNRDYVRAVQASDVRRLREIVADTDIWARHDRRWLAVAAHVTHG